MSMYLKEIVRELKSKGVGSIFNAVSPSWQLWFR